MISASTPKRSPLESSICSNTLFKRVTVCWISFHC
ncbi:Uncharacterised protein [Vibrio cholerae]|nr:Uncharacterised protein [Vibrio cholerae]